MGKRLSTRDPFRIGLVAIAVGAVLVLMVLLLSVVSFGTSSYRAELEHSAGLRAGESVQVHGVDVGKVRSVDLDGDQVTVEFTVDKDIDLGSGTTAQVKVATLLGTHYLEVDPKGGGDLSGDTIALANTSVPYNLQDVINKGTTKLAQLDPVKLAKALTAASETFEATSDDIGPALQGVGRLSNLVVKRSDQTDQLLRSARRVTDQLSRNSGNIVSLMEQTNLVVSELTNRREAIHRLLVETTGLSEALQAIVAQTNDDISPALDQLNLALDTLNSQDDSLKRALKVMAPAMRYLANAVGNGPYADLYVKAPALPADDQRCALGDC